MKEKWITVNGILAQGYKVATGSGKDGRYPQGTLGLQKPLFKERGLDLFVYHHGTLNVSIRPYTFSMFRPQYTFRKVEWTTHHPPEDFSFSRCRIAYDGKEHDGWIYYPHPETKKEHFQDPSLVEVISDYVPSIKYGDRVQLLLNPDEIKIISHKNAQEEHKNNIIIAGDGHFHLYPCCDPARAIDTLINNLNLLAESTLKYQSAIVVKIAFLTEGGQYDYFHKILNKEVSFTPAGLEVTSGSEEHCLSFIRGGKVILVLIAGRQIATAERLEILGLGVSVKIPDGIMAEQAIEKILAAGGIPVLPFSPGKWLFRRGVIARKLVEKYGRQMPVGDSALRPIGWGEPAIMRRARENNRAVLPGSDPLPIAGDERYAGRYGFIYEGPFNTLKPLTAIKAIIANQPETIISAGKRSSLINVIMRLSRLHRTNKTSSASSAPLR